jgi:AbiJ N-terminal domain 4/Domain of unknown function (DUF7014)/HEPN domain
MPIWDFFSSREAEAQRSGDVWTYDRVPDRLRVQVSNIVREALGTTDVHDRDNNARPIYERINATVAHEHGIDSLGDDRALAHDQVHSCLRTSTNTKLWLDVVELCFFSIEKVRGPLRSHNRKLANITITAAEAVAELNERFRLAGFGYRYEGGNIIRVSSEFLHQEATRPALVLLSDRRFAGANDEFRAAHDHLKAGENKDCIVDASNALESTMKAICEAKGWTYQKGARASDLLKVLREKKLFPEFAEKAFEQLLATLKGVGEVLMDKGRVRSKSRRTSPSTHWTWRLRRYAFWETPSRSPSGDASVPFKIGP